MEIIQVLCFRTQKEAFSEDATSEAPGLRGLSQVEASTWREPEKAIADVALQILRRPQHFEILVPWDDCQGQQQLWSEAYMHQRDEILVLYM